MPDISLCMNISCPLRLQCYRYRAIRSERQSFTSFSYKIISGKPECDSFKSFSVNRNVIDINTIDSIVQKFINENATKET